jgi:hypothetical protein
MMRSPVEVKMLRGYDARRRAKLKPRATGGK